LDTLLAGHYSPHAAARGVICSSVSQIFDIGARYLDIEQNFVVLSGLGGSWVNLPRWRCMKMLRILIVEDEPFVAMDLEIVITEIVTATVVVEPSVAATKKVLHEALDFAFLDVDVTNGKTFEIAQILERNNVPFAFVSGSPQEELPRDLRSVPFIPKPFCPAQIERLLRDFS
jgi:CheY-like chemotaxis protein